VRIHRVFGNADTRGVIASVIVHTGIALLFLRASLPPKPIVDTVEIDLVATPPPPPPEPLRELDLGVAATAKASTRNVAATSHLASVAVITEKSGASVSSPNENAIPNATEQSAESASGAHLCEGNDCVLEALNRCLAGDGDGCTEVGGYYEQRRGDPFSAIKWYVKGCDLESRSSCAANDRVKNAMPVGWAHHPFFAPGGDSARDPVGG
jgi:hypothetical protein